MNPILFVYAMKLVWGVFDENNNLEQVFYCTEDAFSTMLMMMRLQFRLIALSVFYIRPVKYCDRKLWFDKIFDMRYRHFPHF
jgi:hypothetical protein